MKLPRGARPHAVVWTKRRVKEWKRTGVRPAVAVWTPAQLARFLASIAGHRLFAVFHLIAMRGLHRGEACGLRWEDLDLDEGLRGRPGEGLTGVPDLDLQGRQAVTPARMTPLSWSAADAAGEPGPARAG